MLVLILGIVAIAALFYYYIVKPMNYWKDRGVPQGNPSWVFGHGFGVFSKTQTWTDLVMKLYHQSPGTRYTGMYNFHLPLLVLKDPELIKKVTIKDFDHFVDHIVFLPSDSDPLWEKNLLGLQGQKWREMRAFLSPSFTSSKMRSMFTLMVESTENFIQYFRKKDEDVIVVEMKDAFARFATDIIATTACGLEVNSLEDPHNEFYLMGQDAVNFNDFWRAFKITLCMLMPFTRKIMTVQLFSDEVRNFFRNLINETIKAREEKGIVRYDIIHLLLEARKGINAKQETDVAETGFATAQESSSNLTKEKVIKSVSNDDITAQAVVFFFAGFDTVSTLMSFTVYELALNQDIQDRLRSEVNSTWTECKGKLTYEALMKMKYLDMVISECLRKWPVNPSLDRICTKPYTIEPELPGEQPVYLKKNDPIWLPVYAIHRDPNYYPNPDKFDPERFSDENKGSINPYTYFPFGLGPRNCIGSRFALMETKVVLFYILLHFEVVPVEKTPIPFKVSKKYFALTSETGFWIGLKKIKKEQ